MMGGYVGALVIAAAAAAIELAMRYRDDIRRAVLSWPAAFYVLLNGLIGLGAAWLLVNLYADLVQVDETNTAISPAKLAFIAGFGSLAVLRAGIMKVKIGRGDEVSVGPGFIIERLLALVDRLVDRQMASYRGTVADSLVGQVDFDQHATALVTECLTRLSNISAEEGRQLTEFANALNGRNDINARQKTRSLLMQLLSVVGERVLRESVASVTS